MSFKDYLNEENENLDEAKSNEFSNLKEFENSWKKLKAEIFSNAESKRMFDRESKQIDEMIRLLGDF